jgi:hypothetical protein
MGLDMYLSAKKYASTLFSPEIFEKVVQAAQAESFLQKDHPSVEVSVSVAYWRKANAIHRWFVENVQDGNDDCGSYHVAREQLETLIALCKEVLSENAYELLPTQEGFFFGGTEYDDWYLGSLKETIEQLSNALNKTNDDWSFEYHSSW